MSSAILDWFPIKVSILLLLTTKLPAILALLTFCIFLTCFGTQTLLDSKLFLSHMLNTTNVKISEPQILGEMLCVLALANCFWPLAGYTDKEACCLIQCTCSYIHQRGCKFMASEEETR